MKEKRILWDMPITIEIVDKKVDTTIIEKIFQYFHHIDTVFSTFNQTSEISKINKGDIKEKNYSDEMVEVLSLCEKTKKETFGYFDHIRNGRIDPLGVVKGWAIKQACKKIQDQGFQNFYIEAGGDIQAQGYNQNGEVWSIGIRNPFNRFEIVKSLSLTNCGVATSGTYIRGDHIQNPHVIHKSITDIVSLTVIASDVCKADRFATAAFAMGKKGIYFIEQMQDIEGYMIDQKGIATFTSGFAQYIKQKQLSIPVFI